MLPHFRTLLLIIISFSVLGLFSCKKSSDQPKSETETGKTEMTTVGENDLSESDEDLLTVDYKEFYDELAPHGEWVQVSAQDLGLQMKTSSVPGGSKDNSTILDYLSGVKNANATASVGIDLGAFFVWKPSDDIAIGITTGQTQVQKPVYTPYSNGQWVNTDQGWYFQAATPYEETTSHYGRWAMTPDMGWVWVPGRVWSPAWVEMRENNDYVAWTPIPPSVYFVNNVFTVPVIEDADRYVVVEKRYFVEPTIYKYMYLENKNKIMIKEMTKTNGIMVMNKTIINKGPELTSIETITGKKIEMVKIKRVDAPGDVKYTSNEFYVYNRKFTKVKSVEKGKKLPVTGPVTYKTYNDVKTTKVKEKSGEKESKEINKEDKEKVKEVPRPGPGPTKENDKGKDKGNDKGKDKGSDKSHDKGSDKGKDKGTDKSHDNGSDKGNDKGNKEHGPKGKK